MDFGFEVGDVVVVRTTDEIMLEFGYTSSEDIPYGFIKDMEACAGTYVTVGSIERRTDPRSSVVELYPAEHVSRAQSATIRGCTWAACMVKPLVSEDEEYYTDGFADLV